MTESQYWKLKFDIQEVVITRERATAALKSSETKLIDIFKSNGLDPAKSYRFNDESFDVSEVEPPNA